MDKRAWGLSPNVVWLGVVSFLNDLASDMVFSLIPIFLTSVLGATLATVGLIEGVADAMASISKVASGWISDKLQRRKALAIFGYSFSAITKPLLAFATSPFHVLLVRFGDRVGKGVREAPRDALISLSIQKEHYGAAFGFHRAMDTAGATLGPLLAFFLLPVIHNNLRMLFLLSFVASFFAVLVLIIFVRDIRASDGRLAETTFQPFQLKYLGLPFYLFLVGVTLFSLGKASEAFLILRAREVGIAIVFIPILYFVFNLTYTLLSSPFGILADRVGKRWTLIGGYLVFAGVYFLFSLLGTMFSMWLLFVLYGFYQAATEGVSRAIVADLVPENVRGTAYGLLYTFTGLALLPASLIFGYLYQTRGSSIAFDYGAVLALGAVAVLVGERWWSRRQYYQQNLA